MVTLYLGPWVTLYPEEELLRVLTLHSPGGGGSGGWGWRGPWVWGPRWWY